MARIEHKPRQHRNRARGPVPTRVQKTRAPRSRTHADGNTILQLRGAGELAVQSVQPSYGPCPYPWSQRGVAARPSRRLSERSLGLGLLHGAGDIGLVHAGYGRGDGFVADIT